MNCFPTYCGMEVDVENGRVVKIRGDKENPDSRGRVPDSPDCPSTHRCHSLDLYHKLGPSQGFQLHQSGSGSV